MDDASIVLAAAYLECKLQYPNEGRRKWLVRAADEVWKTKDLDELRSKAESFKESVGNEPPWKEDSDPLDQKLDEGVGLIVRTNFDNDVAWEGFLKAVKAAEEEGAMDDDEEMDDDDDDNSDEEDDEDDEEMEESPETDAAGSSTTKPASPSVFHIVQPPSDNPIRAQLSDASNLTVLRLFCDLVIVAAPKKPEPKPDEYFIAPKTKGKAKGAETANNRLAEKYGLKEVYRGRVIWVYDSESNTNGSVRVLNSGDDGAYGSSTGDSWRARAAHMWELQVNLASGALKIDFGSGMGGSQWTVKERMRNYAEAGEGLFGQGAPSPNKRVPVVGGVKW